jgi:hypothetical protein
MLKKVFILSLTLLVLLLISWGAYYYSFKKSFQDSPEGEFANTEESENILDRLTSTIEPVLEVAVITPVLDADNISVLYFQKANGLLYRFNPQTLEKDIVYEGMPENIISPHWNEARQEVMMQFQDHYALYNIKAADPILFKDDVVELTWDSLSEKIVYVYKDPLTQERSINISQPNGSNWKELVRIGNSKVKLDAIPRSPYIAYWPLPNNATSSTLKTVNILTGEEKTLLTEKKGADYLWSPNGKKVLVSFVSGTENEISLAVMNNTGGEFRTLSNTHTLASKCAWSKDNIHVFCAVPTSIPQDTLMPDAYVNKDIFTKDTFWKISTQTGTMERIVNMDDIKQSFDASHLFLSGDETLLYFVERRNEYVYKIKL